MERRESFQRKVIYEALWLWTALAAGITVGTGVTAFLYAVGIPESSALTAGFIAMSTLFVVFEVLYRTGTLPLPKHQWFGISPSRTMRTMTSPRGTDFRELEAALEASRAFSARELERAERELVEALRAEKLEHEKELERAERELVEALRAKHLEHEKELERLERKLVRILEQARRGAVDGQGPSAGT